MTSGPGKGSQARLSDVAQQEGHLAPRSATWLWPQLRGHGRLVKLAKTYPGTLPRYGKTPSRIGRTSQHGGPLAGRLPKWAKEAERAALQEIHVQRASEKKDASQKAPLREKWNELMLISGYFSGALLKADLGWIHPTFVNTSHFPKHRCILGPVVTGPFVFSVYVFPERVKLCVSIVPPQTGAAHRVSLTHFKNQF